MPLYALGAGNASEVWAAGRSGTMLRSYSSGWTLLSSGSEYSLQAVWGTNKGALELYAVGLGGVVLRSTNGSNWSKLAN